MAIEGLATAGGIQGNVADAALAILKHHEVEPAVKWVDNFIFFQVPLLAIESPSSPPTFKFDLNKILRITAPLGIPWHPITWKGQDFSDTLYYVSFTWDIVR